MKEWLQAGRKIGVVGAGSQAREVILAGKKLGYQMYNYNPCDSELSGKVADEYTEGQYNDEQALRDFAAKVDMLAYTTQAIDSELIAELSHQTLIPQGDFLLSISQDKILRKNVLENMGIVIVPQQVVVNKEDLYKAIEEIGYPAILKSNVSADHEMFYEEADIDAFDYKSAAMGVSILEAWIPVDSELTVSAAIDVTGEFSPLTIAETAHRNGKLYRSYTPAKVSDEVVDQALYISKAIAEVSPFHGALTVEFLKTAADLLYVQDIKPYVSFSTSYTKYTHNISQYEAFVRSMVNWPLLIAEDYQPAVTVQFYAEHVGKVLQNIPEHPEWLVDFYNQSSHSEETRGQLTVVGDDVPAALQSFADLDIWHTKQETVDD